MLLLSFLPFILSFIYIVASTGWEELLAILFAPNVVPPPMPAPLDFLGLRQGVTWALLYSQSKNLLAQYEMSSQLETDTVLT